MAIRTLLVATAGAIAGALATALLLTSRASPFPTVPSRFFRIKPNVLSEIVDPAGIFQYGW